MPSRLLLCLGLILTLATARAQVPTAPGGTDVPLQNPGFEGGLEGWRHTAGDDVEGLLAPDTEVKHEGASSLRLMSLAPGQWPWVYQDIGGIQPGATYSLSAWHRGAAEGSNVAALKLEFLNAESRPVGSRIARVQAKPETWEQMTLSAAAGLGATTARVLLRMVGEGDIWLDDIALVRAAEAPALVPEPARFAGVADRETTVKLRLVALSGAAPEPAKVKLDILAGDKVTKTVEVEFVVGEAQTLVAETKLPALRAGDYTLRAKLPAGEVAWKLFLTPAKRQPGWLSPKGVLLRGGKPFFPVGVYHVASGDYQYLLPRGFNAAQGLATHDLKVLGPVVQAAAEQGFALVIPLHAGGLVTDNFGFTQEKLRAIGRNSAVIGWKALDEPDLHPEVADQVPETYRKLRQMDGARPVILSLPALDGAPFWVNFCDILEVSAFPLPDRPLSLVADRIAGARQLLQPNQGLFALLQAGWSPRPGWQPTAEQARVMAYLAVLSGATGVFWYTLRDPGWSLMQTPLWDAIKPINEETARLGLLATTATPEPLTVEGGKVHAGAWQEDKTIVIVAVANPDPVPQAVVLKLGRPVERLEVAAGQLVPELKDGVIHLTVPAGAAGVIVVNPPAPPAPATPPPAPTPTPPAEAPPAPAPTPPPAP